MYEFRHLDDYDHALQAESVTAFVRENPNLFDSPNGAVTQLCSVARGQTPHYKKWIARKITKPKLRSGKGSRIKIKPIEQLDDIRLLGMGMKSFDMGLSKKMNKAIIKNFLNQPLPDPYQFERGMGFAGLPQHEFVKACIEAAGINMTEAGRLIGLSDTSFQKFTAPPGKATSCRMRYVVWYTFMDKIRI